MKGDKWKLFKKFATVFTSLFVIFVISLVSINSASAVTVPYNSFGIRSEEFSGSDLTCDAYTFTDGLTYNQRFSVNCIRDVLFQSAPGIEVNGNNVTFNAKINLVANVLSGNTYYGQFKNLDYLKVGGMSLTDGTNYYTITPQSGSFQTYVTRWGDYNQYETLTIIVSGVGSVPSNAVGKSNLMFRALVGTMDDSRPLFTYTRLYNSTSVYFEPTDTPITVNFNTSVDNALLQQQVDQNNTIIGQNQQIINQDNQDRSDIQSASDSADSNADTAQSQNEGATSNLLNLMGSFIEALQTPATNCRVPADLGNLDLGTIDFCTGKPAEFVPIINTISALVMSFAIYLVARHLVHSFIRITVFAQGGKE